MKRTNEACISLPGLPWTSGERVRFRCQSSDWAEVDHVPGQFRFEQLLNVSSHLHVRTPSCSSEVLHPGHLMCKPACITTITAAVLVSQAESIVRSLTNMAVADSNGYLKSTYVLNINKKNRRTKHYTYSRVNFYKNRASLFKQSYNAAMLVGEASRRLQRLLLF